MQAIKSEPATMENTIRNPPSALVAAPADGAPASGLSAALAGPSLIPEAYYHVRTLSLAEHREAALSLAQAFASDDLARYLVGAEDPGLDDLALWRLRTYTYLRAFPVVVRRKC